MITRLRPHIMDKAMPFYNSPTSTVTTLKPLLLRRPRNNQLAFNPPGSAMPATAISSAASVAPAGFSPPSSHRFSISSRKPVKILAMAAQKKVNRYDGSWKKQWYGAGIFVEGSEDVSFDVVKKIEERKVLSGVEKAGLLSKAEKLGFTLSSIEKLGFFSKAEDLGLLSLLEKAASLSPSTLASFSLPLLAASLATIVLVPDDSPALVAVQTAVAALLAVGGAGSFVGSLLLAGLQESE